MGQVGCRQPCPHARAGRAQATHSIKHPQPTLHGRPATHRRRQSSSVTVSLKRSGSSAYRLPPAMNLLRYSSVAIAAADVPRAGGGGGGWVAGEAGPAWGVPEAAAGDHGLLGCRQAAELELGRPGERQELR